MDVPALVGLCGRAGAGKTTVANILTQHSSNAHDLNSINNTMPQLVVHYTNPWRYIMQCLHGIDLQINADLTGPDANNELLLQTIECLKTLHPDIAARASKSFWAPEPDLGLDASKPRSGRVAVGFADMLKPVCTALSGCDYYILLGEDARSRVLREKPISTDPDYFLGSMSGRQLLERVGTDCFRAHDPDYWIKITKRRIAGSKVVITDVRFENELKFILDMGGRLMVIARSLDDLILTEADKQTHVSKWKFLTFIDVAKNNEDKDARDILVLNNGSINDLAAQFKECDSLR
jgi:hypothetical protein